MNKRLIRKFCEPFPNIPPVAFFKKHDQALVSERSSTYIDMLANMLFIPKERLQPINNEKENKDG